MTPQIIAHRGASYLAPENTLTAFKKAMEIGADGVEMDVQQTIDAGLVIHHDYMIDLHTDISGKIYDMTMGDLKELDFGSWKDAIYQDEKIATLQEAMELCKQMPECTVHLELKSTMDNDPDFVPRVLEVLQQTEMVEQVILVSFNHALLRQAKQLLPELRVGALVYGELESMLLPPPIIWKDLGLTNGMEDMEAMDAALPESAADEENCSWMTRWMSDKVSMLRANFPGESLNEIYKNLMAQRDLPTYIRSLDFVPEWVSCEYHTAYKNAGFIDKLHEMGIKVSLWTVDTEDSVRSLLRTGADAAAEHNICAMLYEKARQCAVALTIRRDDLGAQELAVFGLIELELCGAAKVLEHLTVFERDCDFHENVSFTACFVQPPGCSLPAFRRPEA